MTKFQKKRWLILVLFEVFVLIASSVGEGLGYEVPTDLIEEQVEQSYGLNSTADQAIAGHRLAQQYDSPRIQAALVEALFNLSEEGLIQGDEVFPSPWVSAYAQLTLRLDPPSDAYSYLETYDNRVRLMRWIEESSPEILAEADVPTIAEFVESQRVVQESEEMIEFREQLERIKQRNFEEYGVDPHKIISGGDLQEEAIREASQSREERIREISERQEKAIREVLAREESMRREESGQSELDAHATRSAGYEANAHAEQLQTAHMAESVAIDPENDSTSTPEGSESSTNRSLLLVWICLGVVIALIVGAIIMRRYKS